MTTRAPSIKTLTGQLRLTQEQAETVRALIKGEKEPDTVDATDAWIRQCYHRPSQAELIMHAIDATIETHGVEALGASIDNRFTPQFVYCNAGDTYAATIIRNNETGSYFVGCWGMVVERARGTYGQE